MNPCKIAKIVFFVLMLFSMHSSAGAPASVELSQYSVMLCGTVPNGVLSDIDSSEQILSPSGMVDLMILISKEDPDAISYGRVVSDGKIFFKGGGALQLDISFITTLDNGVQSGTVIYLYKNNKRIGGLFYSNESDNVKPKSVYISNTGSVYHVNFGKISDEDCFDRFK